MVVDVQAVAKLEAPKEILIAVKERVLLRITNDESWMAAMDVT
jgi:hypothetical protein